jgi:hypothetical protein
VTSWAYRVSERIPDGARSDVRQRLDDVIAAASVLLVVGTPQWWTPWTQFEVTTARRHGVPVVVVRPAGVPASRRAVLADMTSLTVGSDARSAAALVRTLATVARAARTPTAAPSRSDRQRRQISRGTVVHDTR